MPLKRSKIAILVCGGSTLRLAGRQTFCVERPANLKPWLQYLKEAQIIADLKLFFLFGNQQAQSLGLEDWQQLAKVIKQNYQRFDSFIVTYFLESINQPATALSFIFPSLNKPIIFTGSFAAKSLKDWQAAGFDYTELYRDFNFQANFINALQASNLEVGEVGIIIGNRLLRANQLQHGKFLMREAEKQGLLGQVDFGVRLISDYQGRQPQKFRYCPEFSEQVTIWGHQPWNSQLFLKQTIASGSQAVIILSFQNKNQLQKMKSTLQKLAAKEILVVLPQKKPVGITGLPTNTIFIQGLTLDTLHLKVMWILGQKQKLIERKKLLRINIAGEFIS